MSGTCRNQVIGRGILLMVGCCKLATQTTRQCHSSSFFSQISCWQSFLDISVNCEDETSKFDDHGSAVFGCEETSEGGVLNKVDVENTCEFGHKCLSGSVLQERSP